VCVRVFPTVQITQEVRQYAAEHGLEDEDSLRKGMDEMSQAFLDKGYEIYIPEDEVEE